MISQLTMLFKMQVLCSLEFPRKEKPPWRRSCCLFDISFLELPGETKGNIVQVIESSGKCSSLLHTQKRRTATFRFFYLTSRFISCK